MVCRVLGEIGVRIEVLESFELRPSTAKIHVDQRMCQYVCVCAPAPARNPVRVRTVAEHVNPSGTSLCGCMRVCAHTRRRSRRCAIVVAGSMTSAYDGLGTGGRSGDVDILPAPQRPLDRDPGKQRSTSNNRVLYCTCASPYVPVLCGGRRGSMSTEWRWRRSWVAHDHGSSQPRLASDLFGDAR